MIIYPENCIKPSDKMFYCLRKVQLSQDAFMISSEVVAYKTAKFSFMQLLGVDITLDNEKSVQELVSHMYFLIEKEMIEKTSELIAIKEQSLALYKAMKEEQSNVTDIIHNSYIREITVQQKAILIEAKWKPNINAITRNPNNVALPVGLDRNNKGDVVAFGVELMALMPVVEKNEATEEQKIATQFYDSAFADCMQDTYWG